MDESLIQISEENIQLNFYINDQEYVVLSENADVYDFGIPALYESICELVRSNEPGKYLTTILYDNEKMEQFVNKHKLDIEALLSFHQSLQFA